MLPSPPNSTELKSSFSSGPTTELELPEPIEPLTKKGCRKGPRRNHSEIERRRRERLNVKYNELRELVPACRAFRFARRGGDAGLHKLDILTEAVNYITELEDELKNNQTMKVAPEYSYVPLESLANAASALETAKPLPGAEQTQGYAKHNLSYLMN